MLRHGPLVISRTNTISFIDRSDVVRNLPARVRSRFGRHLARGGSAVDTVRTECGRGDGRRATAATLGSACVRAPGACAQLPAICFALRLRIGLSLKAAENEIILSYRYGTRCGAFQ